MDGRPCQIVVFILKKSDKLLFVRLRPKLSTQKLILPTSHVPLSPPTSHVEYVPRAAMNELAITTLFSRQLNNDPFLLNTECELSQADHKEMRLHQVYAWLIKEWRGGIRPNQEKYAEEIVWLLREEVLSEIRAKELGDITALILPRILTMLAECR